MLGPILAELVRTRDKAEAVGGRERQKVRQSVHSESDKPSQHNLSHLQQTHEGHRSSERDGHRKNAPNAHPALGCWHKFLISQQHASHQELAITPIILIHYKCFLWFIKPSSELKPYRRMRIMISEHFNLCNMGGLSIFFSLWQYSIYTLMYLFRNGLNALKG